MTVLDKFKTSMKESIKFIERIERLFGSWDAAADFGGELPSTDIGDLIDRINDALIEGKE